MRYFIQHQTTYNYAQAIELLPHTIRLRPRVSGSQLLHQFSCQVLPLPQNQTLVLDAEGNSVIHLWWGRQPTQQLQVQITAEVETLCTNPFNFVLEPWATHFPLNYPTLTLHSLQAYLTPPLPPVGFDPVAYQLAQDIAQACDSNIILFLNQLTQKLYEHSTYQIREVGSPWPPCLTWQKQSGSCRDLTVLFMEACRCMGLAARFVSGYQEGDTDSTERHLHAWAEVYLPGAGWLGYDPTHGLAVADRHIALVAAAHPLNASPVSGSVRGSGVQSEMSYQLAISVLA
ncbi:transglutaminase family protein [Synechococcus sp. PCC 6312]|uniref:transglutaminase family protein n=1 Tax=Synechococcus sp. (strain ATCC 27167 / PCC 6312) TaxID=195253 RepID=UPI00029F3AFC|nr:transglutaminase family protein [Synechococcus sp. PCC 6312]AFY60182.1 transglutaminase-like enzyme, predicted cysteine protease [Synechococcus sp. PCC 6312]